MHQPGWYRDPSGADAVRWWDGSTWTEHIAYRTSATQSDAYPSEVKGVGTELRTKPRISNRSILFFSGAAALALIVGVNGIASAVSSGPTSAPAPLAAVPSETATPTPAPTPTGPTVTYETVSEDEVIPFNRVTQDDPNADAGTSYISTPGADGKYTRIYKVTYHDGVEVARSMTQEGVSVAAVDEVTTNGTYVAPPPPQPVADSSGGCDPNYADGCVPIASDVDCAGGSGNGPAYFSGTARVVGSDIYDLDRDGNGIACQS